MTGACLMSGWTPRDDALQARVVRAMGGAALKRRVVDKEEGREAVILEARLHEADARLEDRRTLRRRVRTQIEHVTRDVPAKAESTKAYASAPWPLQYDINSSNQSRLVVRPETVFANVKTLITKSPRRKRTSCIPSPPMSRWWSWVWVRRVLAADVAPAIVAVGGQEDLDRPLADLALDREHR